MEFGIKKCAILIMRNREQQMTEGIELTNQEKIRKPEEKNNNKKLRNTGSRHHQTS